MDGGAVSRTIITRDTMIGVALPQADWTASGPPSATKVAA